MTQKLLQARQTIAQAAIKTMDCWELVELRNLLAKDMKVLQSQLSEITSEIDARLRILQS